MEKKRIFTIRKLKTGVASVGIAVILLGVSAVQVRGSEVSAEELPNQTVIEGNLVRNEGALDESLSTVNKEIIQEADLTESQAEIEILEGSTSVNDNHIPVESSPEAVPIPYDAPVENNPTNTISSSNIKSANTDFEAQESSVLRNQEVILVEDKIGPEIIDISVNKELYRRNEIMFVTVELKDESPIEKLDISFYESSGGYRSTSIQVLITEFEKNEAGNYVGTGYATTPTSTSNTDAEFYLSSGTATDIYGNTTSVNSSAYDVVDVRFKVSDKPELNAPEILEVKLDKGVYAPGEEVEITVLATDDSLVSSAGLEFHGDQYSDVRRPRVDIISFVKDETGNYVGTGKIKIPDFTISDTYRLNNVYVSDKYGNGASYNPEWNISDIHLRNTFKVSSDVNDIVGPEIINISVNKELYRHNEIMFVTVELKDESPIEKLDISFYESSGGYRSTSIQVLITEFEKNEAGNYVGTGYATTPTSTSNTDAEFYLSSGTATDIYGNTTSVNSSAYDVVDVRFKVSDKPELNAPEILEVKLDKGVYAPGEEVEITVLATDDSLVSSAGLEFHGDQYSDVRRPRVDIISFVKDETGNYVGTGKIKIPDFTISDTYRLNNVYVSDKYGNGASYNPEWNISDIHLRNTFKVSSDVNDIVGPEIINISVNKELYRHNEIMFVTVELKDESPIEKLDISFYESSGGYRSTSIQVLITEFEKNEAGNYVGTGYATTPTSTSNTDAEFYLSSGTATDIYGNTTSVNSSAYDVVDVRFKVSDKPELNAPEILEVKLDKGVYAPGEEVEITVLATDDSLVSSAGLEFHGDQYSDVRRPRVDIISFVKDETGNYVGTGKIKIPDFTISDTYRLNNVYVSDKYGNGASYNPEWNISDIHLRAIFKVAVDLKVFEETRSEIITFNTEFLDNPEILVGTEIVVKEGIDGLQNILEKITTVSGNEISREIISTELISNPVSAIVHRGTKAAVIENVAQTTENVTTLKLIAFETEYIDNPNLLLGLQEIVQEGVDGTRTIVEKVITVAGEEISREIINDTIVDPINKVVQRGTAAVIKDTIATDVIRYEGSNREAVAVNVARAHFGDSKKVIIVNRDKFPDAISATNISQGQYPVLYTRADRIDQITLDLLKTLPLDEVYILGGTGSVSDAVISHIKLATGVAVTRVDGKDRFEVNVNAIQKQYVHNEHVVIASGDIYTDALYGVSYANTIDAPVLLAKKDRVTEPIIKLLESLGVKRATLVGGVNTLTQGLETQLSGLGIAFDRIAGTNRYSGSVEVAKTAYDSPENIVIASGDVFSDALVSAPLAQKLNAPILLVRRDRLDSEINDYLNEKKPSIQNIYIQGGTNTIAESSQKSIQEITTYEVETLPIPFETIKQEDSDLLVGQSEIIQDGINGIEKITYDLFYDKGVVTSRIESNRIIRTPVPEIVKFGTKTTGVKNETLTENERAFSVVSEEDATLALGQREVTQIGKVGYDLVTYEVTFENNIEISRMEIGRETFAPVNEIVRIGTQIPEIKTETVNENEVLFSSISREDNTLNIGQTVINQSGVLGYDTVTYEVTYVNGIEIDRIETDRIKVAPVDEILALGTKPLSLTSPRTAPNGITIEVIDITFKEEEQFKTLTVNYKETNNTLDRVDQNSFKLYLIDGTNHNQYGFFNTLMPGESTIRTFKVDLLKEEIPQTLEYGDVFFNSKPVEGNPIWDLNYLTGI